MTIEKQAVTAIKWMSLAKAFCQLLSWAITLVVIRILSPADYGVVAIAAVLISFLSTIAELGLGAAIVQARHSTPEVVARVTGAVFVLHFVCVGILILFAPLAALLLHDDRLTLVIGVAALQLLPNALAVAPEALAYRKMRFRLLAGADFVSVFVGGLATLGLAVWGAGYWSLLAGTLVTAAFRTIVLVAGAGWVAPRIEFAAIGSQLRFGGALTGGRLAWQFTQQCDILIGSRFLSEQALGVYSVSTHLARMPMQKVMSVLNQVAFPVVARMQDDPERLTARLIEGLRLMSLVVVPAFLGLAAVAPEFVGLVLGQNWTEAAVPLKWACMAMPLQMCSNILSTAVTGIGRADIELRNMLVGVAIVPIALLVGVQYGPAGLAAAWALGVPIVLLANYRRISRALGLSAHSLFLAIRAPLVAAVLMYGAIYALRSSLDIQAAWVRLTVLAVFGATCYAALLTLIERGVWMDLRRFLRAARS